MTEQEYRHGTALALAIADRDGDDAAAAWFKEHEALPLHSITNCPMRSDAPPLPRAPQTQTAHQAGVR